MRKSNIYKKPMAFTNLSIALTFIAIAIICFTAKTISEFTLPVFILSGLYFVKGWIFSKKKDKMTAPIYLFLAIVLLIAGLLLIR